MMSSPLLLVFTLLISLQPSSSFLLPSISGSGDIIKQTRAQAEYLKTALRSATNKPGAAPVLKKALNDNKDACISNMDEAIEAIETSTKLFENAGTEIKQLLQTIKKFQNLNDTPQAIRESAKIIRLLDVLIPKITPSTTKCQNNTDKVLESMDNLSDLLNELSSNNDLYFSPQKKQSLKSSAQIVSKVTNFLIQKSTFKFEHFCTKDKEHNTDFITAVGKMMGDLADLYTDLDGETAANEVRKQEDFTKKVVVKIGNITLLIFSNISFIQATIDKLGDLNLIDLDCNTPGSSNLVADTLDDLAGIIEDVGMDNLCKQLGLDSADCSF
jgi:hypothetical protein